MRRYVINKNDSSRWLKTKNFYDSDKTIEMNYNNNYFTQIEDSRKELSNVIKSFDEYREGYNFKITNVGLIIFIISNNKYIIYDLLSKENTTLDEVIPDTRPIQNYDVTNTPFSIRRIKFEINPDGTFFLPKFVGIRIIPNNNEFDFTYQYEYNCDFLNEQRADNDGFFRFTSDDDLIVSNSLSMPEDDEENPLIVTDGFNARNFKWFTPGFFYKQQYRVKLIISENNIEFEGLNLYIIQDGKVYYPTRDGADYTFDFSNYPEIDTTKPFNFYCDDKYYKPVVGYLEVR